MSDSKSIYMKNHFDWKPLQVIQVTYDRTFETLLIVKLACTCTNVPYLQPIPKGLNVKFCYKNRITSEIYCNNNYKSIWREDSCYTISNLL